MGPSTTTLVADDVEIVRRILSHIDAGTTDEGEPWREPVQNYLDPRRFADEMRLLRSLPTVFVPSAAIPNPGDHVERVSFGVPLFAVRGHDGRARVFRNACRHRGMSVVEGQGCSHALVCPYHGWTYRLDGSLAHVPHADGFPDLDMASRGLVEVESREFAGLMVIEALEPAHTDDKPHSAFDALSDGSPWRDKLHAAEPTLVCGLDPATDELEGSCRTVRGGLPHSLDASRTRSSLSNTTTSPSSRRSGLTVESRSRTAILNVSVSAPSQPGRSRPD